MTERSPDPAPPPLRTSPPPHLRRGASSRAAAADAGRGRPAPPVPGEGPGEPAPSAGRDEGTEFLLQSLRDLDRERVAGDIDEHDYRALRDDYTARAAAALRAEQRGQAPPPPPAPTRSWLQRGLVLLGVAGFAVLAGVLVAQAVGQRDQGEGVTGEVVSSPTQEAGRCIDLTERQEYVDALTCYRAVLDEDVDNVVARTYMGWTLVLTARQAGDALTGEQLTELYVQARTQLDRAAEADPGYADARAFQVVLAVWEGRFAEAQRQLDLFDQLDAPADVQQLVDSQRQAVADGLAGEGGDDQSGTGGGEPASSTTTTVAG